LRKGRSAERRAALADCRIAQRDRMIDGGRLSFQNSRNGARKKRTDRGREPLYASATGQSARRGSCREDSSSWCDNGARVPDRGCRGTVDSSSAGRARRRDPRAGCERKRRDAYSATIVHPQCAMHDRPHDCNRHRLRAGHRRAGIREELRGPPKEPASQIVAAPRAGGSGAGGSLAEVAEQIATEAAVAVPIVADLRLPL